MRLVEAGERPKAFVSLRTHARLRHDYATWHESNRDAHGATVGMRLPFEDRSKFDSFTIAEDAVALSEKYPAQVREGPNQNFVVTFDMGYEVGDDARGRRRTSAVTVVLRSTGEVVTVHPGTPWSRDWSEP